MALRLEEIPKIILTPTLESGGDLPDATTYYFIGWLALGVGYYGGAFGEASDQISITTTAANQRIRIEMSFWHDSTLYSGATAWDDFLTIFPDAVTGDTVHRWSWMLKWDYYSMLDGGSVPYKWCNLNDPAITDEFQDSDGHRRWCQLYFGGGIRDYYWNITTAFLPPDPTRTQGVFNHSQLAWRYDSYQVHTPFNMDGSDLLVIAEDDATTYNLNDILDLFETADPSLQDRFSVSNHLTTTNAVTIQMKGTIAGPGEFDLDRLTLSMISCTQPHGANFTFRNCNLSDNQLTGNFWIRPRNQYYDTTWYHTGSTFVLDQITLADNFKPWSRTGTTSYAAIIGFYLADMPYHQWRYYKPTMPIEDSTFKNTYISATANSVTHDYTGENAIEWHNVQFLSPSEGYDIYFTYTYIGPGETGYDEINAYNVFVDRPDGKLRARFANLDLGDGADCIVNVFQAYNLTVKDKDGTEIVGASVSIIDTFSTQYDDDTDINGEVSFDLKSYSVQWDSLDSDGYGNDSRTIDYNDFRMIITANGYQVYEAVFSIYEETDIEIALIEDIVDLNPGGLTNTYETESMRHLFLNEAILNVGDAAGLLPSATPGSLYIALLTDSPGEAGSIASEVTYLGYSRIAVPRTAAGWTEFLGTVRNINQVNFGENGGDDITISHYAVMKEATGSEMVAYGALEDPAFIYMTGQPQFAPAQMEFNID